MSRTVLPLLVVATLVVAALTPIASAQPTGCSPHMPTATLASRLDRGRVVGQGLTVSEGTDPDPFTVEVLGILEDGVGVGRDMIIVEANSPALDAAGGIWAGMSGSPVYVDGQLIGAVAYGLSFVSTGIGGLTPAEDMVDVAGLPQQRSSDPAGPAEVLVDGALAREIRSRLSADDLAEADEAGTSDTRQSRPDGTVALRRLSVPLSVSGLSPERLDVVQQAATDAGLAVQAYAGARADFAQVDTTDEAPAPGENLVVADSYGDITSAAVGTATLACDDVVVGFGHPFALVGPTTAGASVADAITVVPDPGYAPFKLAEIGAVFGTIDQDRFAGVRAAVGDAPDTTAITSRVEDLAGGSRRGRTDVVRPEAVPDLALLHLLGNIDTVIDRLGKGSSSIGFTVTGTGSESGPFTMTRDNVFASVYDIAFDSIFEMNSMLYQLQSFTGEDVEIDAVDITVEIDPEVLAYAFDEVRIGVDGATPAPLDGLEVLVAPGSTITVEIDLVGLEDDAATTATLDVVVPTDAAGLGFLDITGGLPFGGGIECLFDPLACQGEADVATVQDVADELSAQPRNDEVTATLFLEGTPGEPVPPTEEPAPGPAPEPVPTAEPIPTEDPTPQPQQQGTPAPEEPPLPGGGAGEPVVASVDVGRVVSDFTGVTVVVQDVSPFVVRLAGADRIGTALAIAESWFGAPQTVVVAPAGDYPAALVAAPLAAREGAPVLLADDTGLAPAVGDYLSLNGVSRAIVIAPDGQLGQPVEDGLRAAGVQAIERIGGADRYALAGAVADRIGGTQAWLVEGENANPARGWPDAVTAGPVAAAEGVPIMLTRQDDLPAPTADTIARLGITEVSIAGGEAAVGPAVAADLGARGVAVERVAGTSRYDTAVAMARRAVQQGAQPSLLWLVSGNDFPDALAAAAPVALTGGVMLMVDRDDLSRSPATAGFLAELARTAPLVNVVGGEAAISSTTEQQVVEVLVGASG